MKRMTLNAAELDKYIILNDHFGFTTEVLQEASKHEPWSKIVEVINSIKPVLVYDQDNVSLFIGNTNTDTMYLTTLYNNSSTSYTLEYDKETDQLRIEKAEETFISEDNVKTLFGNQSIVGTGNIDLYRHQLTLNYDGEYETLSLIVYSSSNLNVDSLQDLTTLLKPNSNTLYFGNTTSSITSYTFQIIYDNNVWKTGPISEDVGKPNNNITSVSDIVTTI